LESSLQTSWKPNHPKKSSTTLSHPFPHEITLQNSMFYDLKHYISH
jgi:hypothetical protein